MTVAKKAIKRGLLHEQHITRHTLPSISSFLCKRFGVSKASRKYHVNCQFIYRLRWRYDGSPDSLLPHSRRPHSHPNQHTEQELALIRRIRRRNPHDGLVVFWVKLCQHGYTRSISGLYRVLQRSHLAPVKLPIKISASIKGLELCLQRFSYETSSLEIPAGDTEIRMKGPMGAATAQAGQIRLAREARMLAEKKKKESGI